MPTKIEWCDETFNPWWGCERVSPGCAHCYAATFSRRLGMDHLWPRRPSVQNGQEHGFRFFGDEHWAEPLQWARTLQAKLGRRPRVFCASMADVFEERPELEPARERLFSLIEATPDLDWLVLTKRPEFARDWLLSIDSWGEGEPDEHWRCPPNMWLGVSIETSRQTYRADVLREIPAAVRFISAEPLLGSLYPPNTLPDRPDPALVRDPRDAAELRQRLDAGPGRNRAPLDLTDIDWLIIGGESGPHARVCDLTNVRELVEAAKSRGYAGAPAVFVKQLGSKPVSSHPSDDLLAPLKLSDAKGGDMDEWPCDLWIREWPSSSSQLVPSVKAGAE